MISKIRNKWFTANFVLRHRWEDGDYTDYELRQLKSTLNLGMWVKTYEAVGKEKVLLKKYLIRIIMLEFT